MSDEQALIRDARRGDHEAFRKLVECARVNVYRLAYDLTSNRHEAEDLSQEVFIKAYRGLATFRGDAKWNSWLYRITVNTFYDIKRSMRKTISYNENQENDPEGNRELPTNKATSPDSSAEAAVIREHIELALDQLSPRERSVFVLRHYHDQSMEQIAETLDISDGTVKTLLFRAIQKLQQELAFYRNDEMIKRI